MMQASSLTRSSAGGSACSFCKRRLGDEYHFACVRCGATYCYIHMSRHGSACRPRERPSRPISRGEEALTSSANV